MRVEKGKMADTDITDSEKIDKDALEKFNEFEDCEIEIEIPDDINIEDLEEIDRQIIQPSIAFVYKNSQ